FRPVTQIKNVFPVFFPLTADKLMMDLGLVDVEKMRRNEQMEIATTENTIQYPLHEIKSVEPTVKKNILYLVIDTWRDGYMTQEITPNIYKFSKKCQLFENHFSGSNMTTGGIFSLMYGIPATYYDVFTGQQIEPVLTRELRKQNYQFKILSSSNLENPPFNRNAFSGIPNLRLFSKGEKPSERDREINDLWLNSVDSLDLKRPFFGFLFYDSAHGFDYPPNYALAFKPSLPAVNYLELDDDYNPALLVNRYKNSLHYIDSLIGQVLQQLEAKGLLEKTIVVITTDHGQEFNDNKKGYWQHGGNFSKYQIEVPMMIFDPSRAARKFQQKTLHYDLAPTVMKNYLGVSNDLFDYSYGHDLF
ncbi:MAG: sulfatase-like hydrolase/transferase, partial [Bacteroidota bacterium]